METTEVIKRKLVIVGDSECGKTSLLWRICKGKVLEKPEPTTLDMDNYVAQLEVKGRQVHLAMWDTGGLEELDRLRAIAYPDSHVALVCYSIMDPPSLQHVVEKWVPEVKHFCPHIPIVLVGCKSDLRTKFSAILDLQKRGLEPLRSDEARRIAKKIKAIAHVECSSMTGEGIQEGLKEAINGIMKSSKTSKISKSKDKSSELKEEKKLLKRRNSVFHVKSNSESDGSVPFVP